MKFSESHEWVKVEKEVGVVGITEYARKELGEVVYIELPIVGKTIKAGEEVAVLESTKAAADIYSPVSGEIVAVNEALRQNPSLINQSPESEGWLFKIKLFSLQEIEMLLDQEKYLSLLN